MDESSRRGDEQHGHDHDEHIERLDGTADKIW
jgi:hypothetical protein